MIRIASSTKNRHKKVLRLAKGFFGSQSKLFKIGNQRVMKSYQYSFMHRKKKQSDFNRLWLTRINIFCKANNTSYNNLKNKMNLFSIKINNKILGNLLLFDKDLLNFLFKQF